MVLEKLGFREIGFKKLGFGEIIMKVAGSRARVTIRALEKKLGLDAMEMDLSRMQCGFDLGIRAFEIR